MWDYNYDRNDIVPVDNQERVKEILLSSDIKPTYQRVEIAKVLFQEMRHLSAEEILSLININGRIVSKATVYNTLNLFVKKALIKEVIIDPAKVFYDSNTDAHFHFYNEDTGELIDFDLEKIKIDFMPQLPIGTMKSGIEIIIRIKNSS